MHAPKIKYFGSFFSLVGLSLGSPSLANFIPRRTTHIPDLDVLLHIRLIDRATYAILFLGVGRRTPSLLKLTFVWELLF